MEPYAWIIGGGLAVGLLYGLFGVGSAFATPVLSVLGVPGMAAVVGPLPGLVPGSAAGAWSYSRGGKVQWTIARRTLATAVPASVLGALASPHVGGPILLALSGLVLLLVGVRVLRPLSSAASARAATRRDSRVFVMTVAAGVGFASGLLANGGGFLLVPLFLLTLGLSMNEATGTSLVVATALSVPTLLTHAVLGDIDWAVSVVFAVGLLPGVAVGGRLAQRVPGGRLRAGFGVLLVGFAVWFLVRLLLGVLG
ncbi:MAG: sulfite exporter TauE/SafE family protein [Acidimicrobiales bacterium]